MNWYSNRVQSHIFRLGPINRTPGIPGSDKNCLTLPQSPDLSNTETQLSWYLFFCPVLSSHPSLLIVSYYVSPQKRQCTKYKMRIEGNRMMFLKSASVSTSLSGFTNTPLTGELGKQELPMLFHSLILWEYKYKYKCLEENNIKKQIKIQM